MISLLKSITLFALLIAAVLYSQNQNSFNLPADWSYSKTIYKVNTRQFTGEGTFKAIKIL
jgi:hypothetical protein